jgi:DNA-binding transcriptional MerR regulator
MKPQQLARLLNVADVTLRRWAGKEYAEFLSPSAQGNVGARRSFSDTDARILAWVTAMKAQNMSIQDITATLRAAKEDNWRKLPPLPGGLAGDEPIALMPVETAEERVRALQDRYEMQLRSVIKERDELRTQLDAARQENNNMQRETAENTKMLQQRITELSVQEAELRGILRQYTFGNRRWNVVALIAVGLLVGVIFTLLIMVIGTQLSGR